jgi:hypothetical protein
MHREKRRSLRDGACTRLHARPFSDRQVQIITIRARYPRWNTRWNTRPSVVDAASVRVRTVISNSIRIICETQLPTDFFPRPERELRPSVRSIEFNRSILPSDLWINGRDRLELSSRSLSLAAVICICYPRLRSLIHGALREINRNHYVQAIYTRSVLLSSFRFRSNFFT